MSHTYIYIFDFDLFLLHSFFIVVIGVFDSVSTTVAFLCFQCITIFKYLTQLQWRNSTTQSSIQ